MAANRMLKRRAASGAILPRLRVDVQNCADSQDSLRSPSPPGSPLRSIAGHVALRACSSPVKKLSIGNGSNASPITEESVLS